MKQEIGVIFLVAAIGLAAWWYQSKARGKTVAVPNPVTTQAGSVVPEMGQSNVESNESDWSNVPYYLRYNFPLDRGGSGVMPSIVNWGMPDEFNPQEIPPQY